VSLDLDERHGAIGPPAASSADAPGTVSRVGRDGLLSLGFTRVGERTVLARSRYALPLQVLAPVALDDRATIVSMLNPTGGVLGGDRLHVDIDAGHAAHAVLTTPSATKVYRTAGDPACQEVRIRLAPGAIVEWVPDHTIPFPGSAFRQCIDVDVADAAALVLVDAFAAGRVTRGEAWQFALLDSSLAIRDERGWLVRDRFTLRPSDGVSWGATGLAERCPYFATIVVIADAGVEPFIAAVGRMASRGKAQIGAALLPRRGGVVRVLAPTAPALTSTLDEVWRTARNHVLHAPALALRKP